MIVFSPIPQHQLDVFDQRPLVLPHGVIHPVLAALSGGELAFGGVLRGKRDQGICVKKITSEHVRIISFPPNLLA